MTRDIFSLFLASTIAFLTLPGAPYFLADSLPQRDGSRPLRGEVEAPAPPDLGDLQPTGKVNPDGTQVYDYPPGSGLEGIIEVHVGPGGQVVREKVLRPEAAQDSMIAEELNKPSEQFLSFLADHQELRRQS